jgi:hypothetical protein
MMSPARNHTAADFANLPTASNLRNLSPRQPIERSLPNWTSANLNRGLLSSLIWRLLVREIVSVANRKESKRDFVRFALAPASFPRRNGFASELLASQRHAVAACQELPPVEIVFFTIGKSSLPIETARDFTSENSACAS